VGIFSAIVGWFKVSPSPVPEEETECACGGQGACGCGDVSQQESMSVVSDIVIKDLDEARSLNLEEAETVIEEAEKIVKAVTEEKETLSEEVIAAADEAAADRLEKAKIQTTTTPTDSGETGSKPNAKRKRKVSKKARKK